MSGDEYIWPPLASMQDEMDRLKQEIAELTALVDELKAEIARLTQVAQY